MYLLCVYIPETHLEIVKQAIFKEGGGEFGGYDSCSWQTSGIGQFRPLDISQPFLGRCGELETVKEYRLEVVLAESKLAKVVAAVKAAHPYEEPAYHYFKVNT